MSDPSEKETTQPESLATVQEETGDLVVGGPQNLAASPAEEIPAEGTEVTPTPVAATPAEAPIQIGNQTFATSQEAFAYAEKIEQESTQNDMYRQGVLDAQNQQQVPQNVTPKAEENFEEAFYADPQKFLADRDAKIAASVEEKIMGQIEQTKKSDKIWDEFYKENPDLRVSDRLVRSILNDNWNVLGNMPDGRAAMRIVAQKTRAEIRTYTEAAAPQQVLQNTGTGASPGGQTNVTTEKTPIKSLGFVDQVRNLQEKRTNS